MVEDLSQGYVNLIKDINKQLRKGKKEKPMENIISNINKGVKIKL